MCITARPFQKGLTRSSEMNDHLVTGSTFPEKVDYMELMLAIAKAQDVEHNLRTNNQRREWRVMNRVERLESALRHAKGKLRTAAA
jgi:hypothetical protein